MINMLIQHLYSGVAVQKFPVWAGLGLRPLSPHTIIHSIFRSWRLNPATYKVAKSDGTHNSQCHNRLLFKMVPDYPSSYRIHAQIPVGTVHRIIF